MFDSQARFCVLTDFSSVTRLELPVIRTIGTFARDNAPRLDAQVAALAVVAPSPTVRGALRVLFSIKRPAHPYVVVADPDAALDYIETHLAELLRTDARSA